MKHLCFRFAGWQPIHGVYQFSGVLEFNRWGANRVGSYRNLGPVTVTVNGYYGY